MNEKQDVNMIRDLYDKSRQKKKKRKDLKGIMKIMQKYNEVRITIEYKEKQK